MKKEEEFEKFSLPLLNHGEFKGSRDTGELSIDGCNKAVEDKLDKETLSMKIGLAR